ncbi:MAG TPA: glycosyltransferase family 2 protein [Spirochaetia bacterium]|nr:glycosyltransferase family 2 protein [Spirochaetia bacterium]
MKTKVAAVILNYKHLDDTLSCLSALKKADQGKDVVYYVVDNSPTKETAKVFKTSYPKVVYISSPTNPGFAGGNNLAIRQILEKNFTHVLIINPDVTVGKRFFTPLLKHFEDNKVAIVAPAISHTQKNIKMFGLEGKVNWDLAKPEHRNIKHLRSKKPINCEFVTFACVLISTDNFRKVGLLDEGYFMYLEDVDYCLTTKKDGYKIILDPSVLISHETSSSFKHPTQKLKISFKSHLRFIHKWLSPLKRIRPLIYIFLLYPYLYFLWTYHEYKYRQK